MIFVFLFKENNDFFFEETKMEYISTQKVLPNTRCAKEKQKNLYNIYKVGKEKQQKEITLSVAQHCEGIKPPTMVIERSEISPSTMNKKVTLFCPQSA